MLLERVVGPEAAKEMMLASRGEIRASRSVALSLHHARDRRAAKLQLKERTLRNVSSIVDVSMLVFR